MGFKVIMPRPQCAKLSAEEHQNVLRIALWQRALRAVSQKRTGREGEKRGILPDGLPLQFLRKAAKLFPSTKNGKKNASNRKTHLKHHEVP